MINVSQKLEKHEKNDLDLEQIYYHIDLQVMSFFRIWRL